MKPTKCERFVIRENGVTSKCKAWASWLVYDKEEGRTDGFICHLHKRQMARTKYAKENITFIPVPTKESERTRASITIKTND